MATEDIDEEPIKLNEDSVDDEAAGLQWKWLEKVTSVSRRSQKISDNKLWRYEQSKNSILTKQSLVVL